MTYWIRAYDQTSYRVDDFIDDHGFIDWSMKNHFELGDIVFLYATSPLSRLTYMMEVTQTNMDYRESVDDSDYFCSQEHDRHWLEHRQATRYVRFQFLKHLTSAALCYRNLMEKGLGGAPRSPRRLYPEVVDYILKHLE